MAKNKIKELLSITMIIFSLFLFASPTIDTSFFDAGSEKVFDLDLENETEQENDVEGKNVFSLIKHFSFYSLCAYNLKLEGLGTKVGKGRQSAGGLISKDAGAIVE